MDEPMGRRTVGGLLFTKGGSILLFRGDSSQRKATTCCTRLGCGSRLFSDKDRQMCRAANEATTPQRLHLFRKSNRKSQGRNTSKNTSRSGASTCSETNNRPINGTHGRDLLTRLKERVNTSQKRSLSGQSSPSSPNGSIASSLSSSRLILRPLRRLASRASKEDAGTVNTHRDIDEIARRDAEKSDDDLLLLEQMTMDRVPAEEFLSGSLLRHQSNLQGGPSSYLGDSSEDSDESWRFDMEENEELEHYYLFNDQHRGMRMDIDDMSYEELLELGEQIGTVSTGLSEDVLLNCLKRSCYVPAASQSHEDGNVKCIICQEEYFTAEEVGKMACEHYYHVACIQHWLRQKNWCPICKSFASNAKSRCA